MQSVMQFPMQGPGTMRGGNANPKMVKPVKSSGSASDSDDDLDIEDEEPPEIKPAVITIAKPTNDERGKLLWEVVDAVWIPRNKPAPPEKIRSAVKFVGEAVRGLRDQWKETNDRLKKAENSNLPTEGLKVSVGTYREIMETLAGRVTKFGHPSIVKRYVSLLPHIPYASKNCAISETRKESSVKQRIVKSYLRISMIFAAQMLRSLVYGNVLACRHTLMVLTHCTKLDSPNTYTAAVPHVDVSNIS